MMAIALGIILTLGVLGLIFAPWLRREELLELPSLGAARRAQEELAELTEEHRQGRITDEEYVARRSELEARLAAAQTEDEEQFAAWVRRAAGEGRS